MVENQTPLSVRDKVPGASVGILQAVSVIICPCVEGFGLEVNESDQTVSTSEFDVLAM
jgi:hypothetical protein